MREAPSIEATSLRKVYRVAERTAGLGAALKSLFRRTYRDVCAVSDLTFRIEPGERVGFLGPNGAGKTTTLKLLSGLLYPTSGSVRVGGHEPSRRERAFLERITLVMGQKQQLLWDLPPAETFAQNRAIYGISRADFDASMRELDELLDLGAIQKKPTRQLSLGERMKCELAAALLHKPGVLFLDEPTIGLDVSMQLAVREFVRRYNEHHGATVLLTSHYMDDVLALCPRVIVIDQGRLLYDGPLEKLAREARDDKRVTARFAGPLAPEQLEALARDFEVHEHEHEHERARVVLRVKRDCLPAALPKLAELGVVDLTVEDPPLEEIMRELFRDGREKSPEAGP